MTTPPDVHLDVQPPWFLLPGLPPSEPDPVGASEVAAAAWSAAGVKPTRRQVDDLAKMLGQVAEFVRRRPVISAFVLLPEPETGPSVVCRMSAVQLGADYTIDQLLAGVLPDVAQLASPVVTTQVETAAGAAYRVDYRSLGSDGQVLSSTLQLWHLPAEQAIVTLGVSFTDLIEAGRWAPAFTELAGSLTFAPVEDGGTS